MFDFYLAQASDQSGLCWIKAVGKDFSTIEGAELKRIFNLYVKKFTKQYGIEPTVYNTVDPNSTWKNNFMESLLRGERTYMAVWKIDSEGVKEIKVYLKASDSTSGYINVEYSYANEPQCEQDIQLVFRK